MYRKTYIEVDLNNICDNVKSIIKTFPKYKYYIAVVKGNAYGHGEYISEYIIKNGINYLAVGTLDEAINIRKYVDKNVPVLCLEPINLDYIDEVIKNNVTISVSNIDYWDKLKNLNINDTLKFHLAINTGLNRLGISKLSDVERIVKEASVHQHLYMEGIFSHFGTSGLYDDRYKYQIDKFKELTETIDLSKVDIVHLGRSSSLELFPKLDFCNGIRIGIMLYGVNTTFPCKKGLKNKLRLFKYDLYRKRNQLPIPYDSPQITTKNALTLKTQVIDIQNVKADSNVGYGNLNKVSKDCRIAVLDAGYADGLPATYNTYKVYINNKEYSLFGSINMLMMTAIVDETVNIGDEVIIINSSIDYKIQARRLNTSPYQLLTKLPRNIPRVYIYNQKIIKTVEEE